MQKLNTSLNTIIDIGLLAIIALICVPPLLAQRSEVSAASLSQRYSQLSALFTALEWNGDMTRTLDAPLHYNRQAFGGYEYHWDRHGEVVCGPANQPLPHEQTGNYAGDGRIWLGIVLECLKINPKAWKCAGNRCDFVISSEQAAQLPAFALNRVQNRRAVASTRFSAHGNLTLDGDGQISSFSLRAVPEDVFQKGIVENWSLQMSFAPAMGMLLPRQTVIEIQRGAARWRNVLTFSDYRMQGRASVPVPSVEQRFLSAINKARGETSLPPLTWNSKLSQAARVRAKQQLVAQAVNHKGGLALVEILRAGYVPKQWGEVVAATLAGDEGLHTPEQIVVGWMNSPKHRAQLLSDTKEIGVALIEGRLNNQTAQMIVALVAK